MVSFDPTPDKFSKERAWKTSSDDSCWKENLRQNAKVEFPDYQISATQLV